MLQKEKFLPFVAYIEDLIKNEIFQFFDTNGFYKFVMSRILELKLVEHLQLLLDYFVMSGRKLSRMPNEKSKFLRKFLLINSNFLLTACAQDSLDMVKVFIKHRCRLTITPELESDLSWTPELEKDLLRSSIPNPLFIMKTPPKNSKVLHILKMMTTKAYILGCYQAMIETKGIKDCQCTVTTLTRPRGYEQDTWRSESIFFQETVSKMSKEKRTHDCPSSEDFMPDFMNCEEHVECNDPISR